ncbi:hypothetical protein EZV62_025343 [Acer yangbiense]|uniref:Membrane protein of ER body-like protein n=1 Tax=Acer yangbiense TaxID=1000413 RepID=A0A5C7GXK0_9ROSI|nr:hypothetical protein EZV62_025343 [Acer yangbiense]
MDMEAQEQPLQEEEVEENAALLGRQSRQHDNNNSPSNNGAEEKTEENDHNKSVYFDIHQGSATVSEANSTDEELNLKTNKFAIPSTKTNNGNQKHLENESLSGLSPATVQKLHDKNINNLEDLQNTDQGDAEVDLIEEIVNEFTDLDVERVLQKQNTHDLYCPNCNSCITTRVVLRRRRRRVRNIRYKTKPGNNLETPTELDASLAYPPNYQGSDKHNVPPNRPPVANDHNNIGQRNVSPNGPPTPPTIDHNNNTQNGTPDHNNDTQNGTPTPPAVDRNTEIFRCLSCFSLFVPTGNGFKLFQCFGGGSNDSVIIQDVQTIPAPTKNWLSKIFSSGDDVIIDVEPQPDQMHPAQTNPLQTKPVPTQPHQTQPGHDVDPQPDQMHPAQTNPLQTHLVQTKPVPTQPHQTQPGHDVEPQPDQMHPAQTNPLQTHLVQTKPVPTQPHQTQPGHDVEPQPDQIHPAQTHPVQTKPYQTQPGQTQPGQTLPGQTQLGQMQPGHMQPVRTVESSNWDILKSIVYGGLVESITSLGVVSSAAGAGATTLNILALGLASVIGGLFIIADKLKELKKDQSEETSNQINVQEGRYQRLLGQEQNFSRHAVVVILSFIIFGLLPPVIYGFSFRKSDDRDLKIAAVAGSSLVCIVLLAAAKGHVQKPPRSYFRTVLYYVSLGVAASGTSYVVGDLFEKLMEKLGLFVSSKEFMIPFLETDLMNTNMEPAWSSF